MKVTDVDFSRAVLSLQEKLGERPEEMVYRIGCSFSAYMSWLRGDRIPGGEWLIKLLRRCPDKESLAEFGLDIAKLGEQYRPFNVPRTQSDLTDTSPVRPTRPDGRIIPKRYKPQP